MTKTMEEVERFIELRARGYSFEKISQEIGVSKPTLIVWERKNEEQIAELRAIEIQAILEKYKLMRLERAEAFSSVLSLALEELKQRGEQIKTMSTDKLLSMVLLLEKRLLEDAGFYMQSPLEQIAYQDSGSDMRLD